MAEVQGRVVEGTFTGTGASNPVSSAHGFNMSLSGFGTATVALERSFDRGDTWKAVESFTADAERRVDDPEHGIFYRFNCTSYTSGTIAYRLSK